MIIEPEDVEIVLAEAHAQEGILSLHPGADVVFAFSPQRQVGAGGGKDGLQDEALALELEISQKRRLTPGEQQRSRRGNGQKKENDSFIARFHGASFYLNCAGLSISRG